MRLNSSGDLVVVSSWITGWTLSRHRRPRSFLVYGHFSMGPFWSRLTWISEIISPVISEISSLETVPFTTAYYFPGMDAPRSDHILTIPIEMAHHTDTTSVHTGITTVSLAPISTPRMPNVTPTLPPGYRALNASITTPTQTPSGSPGGPSSSGHSLPRFILTLPQFPFGGPFSILHWKS
jgi:hypothetical protein